MQALLIELVANSREYRMLLLKTEIDVLLLFVISTSLVLELHLELIILILIETRFYRKIDFTVIIFKGSTKYSENFPYIFDVRDIE